MNDLSHVQNRRKLIVTLAAIPLVVLIAVTRSVAPTDSLTHELVEAAGWMAILLCISGRMWCTLYIGGRKKKTLVRQGPYSIVRNPLYLFSMLGATRVGLSAGSVAVSLAIGLIVFAVLNVVARREGHYPAGSVQRRISALPRGRAPVDSRAGALA